MMKSTKTGRIIDGIELQWRLQKAGAHHGRVIVIAQGGAGVGMATPLPMPVEVSCSRSSSRSNRTSRPCAESSGRCAIPALNAVATLSARRSWTMPPRFIAVMRVSRQISGAGVADSLGTTKQKVALLGPFFQGGVVEGAVVAGFLNRDAALANPPLDGTRGQVEVFGDFFDAQFHGGAGGVALAGGLPGPREARRPDGVWEKGVLTVSVILGVRRHFYVY